MTLSLGIMETLSRARADLRMGVPVALRLGDRRALAASAETLSQERLDDMRALGKPVLAVTARRAETLKARAYDEDIARILIPDAANMGWISHVADPSDELVAPMSGPHHTERGGAADLHRAGIRISKSARLLPAAVVVGLDDAADTPSELTRIDIAAAEQALLSPGALVPVISAQLPMEAGETGRLHVYRPENGGEEHCAIEFGQPPRDMPVLARLHSACFTGDLLGSLKCDCGPQLRAALSRMGEEGAGILLYLNQEGRGIGLANKMRAYSLQDQGFDTVEANHRLGFEDDERDFRIGAAVLRRMGFSQVRLLTNNPAKVAMMQSSGIDVAERVPLKVGMNPLNAKYLDTKAKKSGHIL